MSTSFVRANCRGLRLCFIGTPFTPAVHAYYALGGRAARHRHYAAFRISTMGNLMAVDIDLTCFARLPG